MFVSSYNTYIQTNASDRIPKQKETEAKSASSFSSKFLEEQKLELPHTPNLPIDYVLRGKSLATKQEIKQQEQALLNPENENISKSKELTKEFMSHRTLQNAKSAYEDNTQAFSIYKKPHHALEQKPAENKMFSEDIQKLKEENMRRKMVNTYSQNDRYYKITA